MYTDICMQYNSISKAYNWLYIIIVLTKTTAAQSDVTLSYRRVRYFFAVTIVIGAIYHPHPPLSLSPFVSLSPYLIIP